MIQGKCPQCGQTYYGYALLQPDNQTCDECGNNLIIEHDWHNNLHPDVELTSFHQPDNPLHFKQPA